MKGDFRYFRIIIKGNSYFMWDDNYMSAFQRAAKAYESDMAMRDMRNKDV